jgi:hypothetical protein
MNNIPSYTYAGIGFYARKYPGPSQEIIEAMSQVCDGNGVSKASPYTNEHRIHPILLLKSSGARHNWTSEVPIEWWPVTVRDTELVACITESNELIETCNYEDFHILYRYRRIATVKLFSAYTGNIISINTFKGGMPGECRDIESFFSLIKFRYGSKVQFDVVENWLFDFVYP